MKEVRLIEIHTGGDGLESLRIAKEILKEPFVLPACNIALGGWQGLQF
jgi:hypothetical protein